MGKRLHLSMTGLVSLALVAVGPSACGGRQRRAAEASQRSPSTRLTPAVGVQSTSFKGDGDDDDNLWESSRSNNPVTADGDIDHDNDVKDNRGKRYLDGDDTAVTAWGHAADAGEADAVTTLVKRYYAALVAGDGSRACSMLYSTFAESVPEDYGQPPGPPALRGKSCVAVAAKMSRQFDGRLVKRFEVTATRVNGGRALVVLGSNTLPASYISLRREHGVWKIAGLIARTLP